MCSVAASILITDYEVIKVNLMYICSVLDFWIGIRMIGTQWYFDDGRLASYLPWKSDEPKTGEQCALQVFSDYVSAECNTTAHMACQKPYCGKYNPAIGINRYKCTVASD